MVLATTPPNELHVVHLVQHPHTLGAPADLRLKKAESGTSRLWWGIFAVVIFAACIATIILLWIFATPNAWHIGINAFWTIVLGVIAYAAIAGISESRSNARTRVDVQSRWDAIYTRAESAPGTIVSADAGTSEYGNVTRIQLVVESVDGRRYNGMWNSHTRPDSATQVYQTQIPGVGYPATLWRAPNETADDPVVIEVVDPSVIQHGAAASVRSYL